MGDPCERKRPEKSARNGSRQAVPRPGEATRDSESNRRETTRTPAGKTEKLDQHRFPFAHARRSSLRVDRSLEPLRSIESNDRSRPSVGDTLGSPMSQAFTPVPLRPAGAPGAASEKGQPPRRGHSAGRRSGDKHGLSDDQAVSLADQITAHEVAETILEKRDRIIAIFGHDLRGLLNALTVNAEPLLRRDGAAAVESARNVRLTIRRMDQLITRLLHSVRLNSNGLEIVPRPLDAAALLREAVEIFRPLARVKSLSLNLAIPDAPLRATADRDRIFQVLSNLLSNAIKFSSVKGTITVEATSVGPRPSGRCPGRGARNPRTRPGSRVRALLQTPGFGRSRARALHLQGDHRGARRKDLGHEPAERGEHVPFHGSQDALGARSLTSAGQGDPRGDGLTQRRDGLTREWSSSAGGSELQRNKRLDPAPPRPT